MFNKKNTWRQETTEASSKIDKVLDQDQVVLLNEAKGSTSEEWGIMIIGDFKNLKWWKLIQIYLVAHQDNSRLLCDDKVKDKAKS